MAAEWQGQTIEATAQQLACTMGRFFHRISCMKLRIFRY